MQLNPVLLPIYGTCAIQWYGVWIALGVLLLIWRATRALERARLMTADQVAHLATWSILAGIFGGKLLDVITTFHDYAHWTDFFRIWEGGFSILGTVVGATLVAGCYIRFLKLPAWAVLDRIALYAPLAHACGRMGCFFAGCCGGINGLPIQLWSAAAYVTILGILLYVSRVQAKQSSESSCAGFLLSYYLCAVGSERFILDFWRADAQTFAPLPFISWYQFNALLIIGSALFIRFIWLSGRRTSE